MAFLRYITDNPYRLLSVGSSISYKELRLKANAAAKAAQVGRPDVLDAAGIEKVFGSEEMARCQDTVYTLANDPTRRTLFRLFWPFKYERPETANGTLADLDQLLTLHDGTFHAPHLRFLRAWFEFETESNTSAAELAFESFAELYNCVECDDYLVELLTAEGEEKASAHDRVCDAQDEIIAHLLATVCRRAMERWDANDVSAAVSLLETAVGSRFLDEQIDRVLQETVVAAGDREMNRIRQLTEQFAEWSPETKAEPLEEITRLQALVEVVKGRLPAARRWREAIEDHSATVALAMRAFAIDLANEKSDHEGALRILQQVAGLPLPAELRVRIEEDLAQAREIVADQAAFREVKPVQSAPWLFTFRGVGFALYGGTPFPPRPDWYIATYFFVVLFIPVLPIARYVVSDGPDGGWYFHGKVSLSRWNKYYLFIVLAVILGCPLYSSIDDTFRRAEIVPRTVHVRSPASVSPASAAHAAGSPAKKPKALADPAATSRPTAVKRAVAPSIERVAIEIGETGRASRLLAEHDRLVRHLNSERARLSTAREGIDRTRTHLAAESNTIDQAREELRAKKEAVERMRQELDVEADAIGQERQALEAEKAQIQSERLRLDRTDEYAVSAFNERVDQHNRARDAFLDRVSAHEGHKKAFNETVDRYNRAKDTFNTKGDRYARNEDEFNRRVRAYNSRLQRRQRAIERVRQIEQALKEMDN